MVRHTYGSFHQFKSEHIAPQWSTRDLAELLNIKDETLRYAIARHPEIFGEPETLMHRIHKRPKKFYDKEKFLKAWAIYEENHGRRTNRSQRT